VRICQLAAKDWIAEDYR